MAVKPYGEFVTSTHPIPTANADRILGAQIVTDKQGRPEWIDVQYETADGDYPFRQMRMSFLDGMFLLSCLKSIQLDLKWPFPDDPRG